MGDLQRVLIVDDSPDTREMYAVGFRLAGFEALEAGTISEAVAMLEAGVDLVVCELRLEDGSGLDVVHRILQPDSVAVYMLADSSEDLAIVDAAGAGWVDVLVKPVPPDDLIAHVAAARPRVGRHRER